MKLHTLWTVYRESVEDVPSLLVAWDEGTIDANPKGWKEAKEKEMAAFAGSREKFEFREIIIDVPGLWTGVLERFQPGTLKGKVTPDAE